MIPAVLILLICLSVTIGGAMAYFTDYEDAYGGAVVQLGGETEIDEGSDARNKHIVITNTGETNMIVRAAVLGNDYEKYMNITAGAGWVPSQEDGITFYYYSKALAPGEATTAIDAVLEDKWTVGDAHPELNDMEITVVHESAQAVYDETTQKLTAPEGWNEAMVGRITPPAHPQQKQE